MKVTYINSACLQIESSGVSILTDPWFTEGIFNGSWYKIKDINPFDYIIQPNIVYISHIHPDHYDPDFLKQLSKKFPDFLTLIPNSKNKYLERKASRDGLNFEPSNYKEINGLHLHIIENNTGSLSDIDSALYIYDENTDKSILNLNDCIFNEKHVEEIEKISKKYNKKIDLLATGYSGASSYPQRYFDINDETKKLTEEAERKSRTTLARYKKYTDIFQAKYNLPFAGEYLLGGKLAKLNKFRGIPDSIEVKKIVKNSVVLDTGGSINLISNEIIGARTKPHSKAMIKSRINEIKAAKLDYEKHFNMPYEEINFQLMIKKSLANALKKSEIKGKFFILFSILKEDLIFEKFLVNTHDKNLLKIFKAIEIPKKDIIEIVIDYRLLYGLLSGMYHWNNIDLGSQFKTKRPHKEGFISERQNFLNFFNM